MTHDFLSYYKKGGEIVSWIAEYKKRQNIPIFHPDREQEILNSKQAQAKILNLDPDFVKSFFELIINQSKINQRKLIQ